jgi:hypothetical protein
LTPRIVNPLEDDVRSILFGSLTAVLITGAAMAQSNPQNTVTPGATMPGSANQTITGNSTTGTNNKDANGAVNTSSAEQAAPATGANSFTRAEARRRIAKHGFTDVTLNNTKDDHGVWRGTAKKDGQQVSVWLDYKGDVGQQ